MLPLDTEPPILTCSSDIVEETLPGTNFAIVMISLMVSDNSEAMADNTSQEFSILRDIGSHLIVSSVADPSGNEANCTIVVTIIGE